MSADPRLVPGARVLEEVTYSEAAELAYNGAKRPDKMLTQFEMFIRLKPDAPEAKKVRAVLTTGH